MSIVQTIPDDALIIRPSSHSTWLLCPLSVQYAYDERNDNTPSEQQAFGTGMHAIIENYIKTGQHPTSGEGWVNAWIEEMESRDEDITKLASPSLLVADSKEMKLAFELWLDTFWNPVGSHLEPLVVEETLALKLGDLPSGREAWLRGTPDLFTTTKGFDWKTSTSGWSSTKLPELTQHLFYSALVEVNHGVSITEFSYVVYDRKRQEWKWSEYTDHFNETAIQLAIEEARKMALILDVQAAPATPMKRGAFWGQDGRGWWCTAKWCGAWDFCEGKHLLADGQAGGSRDSTVTWKEKG